MKIKKLLETKTNDEYNGLDKIIPDNFFNNNAEGNIRIIRAKNLESLKNCPFNVLGYFSLENLPKLKSLKGFPIYIEGDCYIEDCSNAYHELWKICTSVIDGDIQIFDDFMEKDKLFKLKKLCKKYQNSGHLKILKMQNELMDLGYYDEE